LLIYTTADEAVLYMFYRCFFLFFVFFCFFCPPKLWDNRSREQLNGFSWNFYETIPGNLEFETSCRRLAKVVPPPGEWRMLMICVIFAMTLVESPEGATNGGCVIKHELANGFNLVFTVRRYALHGLSYRNSVRLSVRLSVTLVHCVHMVLPTIMISSSYGSHIILVSGDMKFIPK